MIIRNNKGELIGLDKNSKQFFNSVFSFVQNLEELVMILNEIDAVKTIEFEKRFSQIMEQNKNVDGCEPTLTGSSK